MTTMPSETAGPWLERTAGDKNARLRLFCFPYAGGGSLAYRGWHASLPRGVELCPVHLPGRERRMREPCITDSRDLARAAAEALRPHLDVPFAIFGHSMGALIGFEFARSLRRDGGPEPAHLFVSGHYAPQLPRKTPPTYDLPEPEFVEELRRLNGTPREVMEHPELMQLMIPILRADFKLVQTYAYADEPPLGCPITAFGGTDDPEVSRDSLAAWREQTSGAFSLQMFPGDHFFLHASAPLLLRALAPRLEAAAGGPRAS
jgi:medium-chain acyl-[acyl-carrier-protein] hydrolase